LRELKNKRIKKYFEEGNSLEQVAFLVKLSEKEVSLYLKEMGLLTVEAA
jgi:hypothetical protein